MLLSQMVDVEGTSWLMALFWRSLFIKCFFIPAKSFSRSWIIRQHLVWAIYTCHIICIISNYVRFAANFVVRVRYIYHFNFEIVKTSLLSLHLQLTTASERIQLCSPFFSLFWTNSFGFPLRFVLNVPQT